MIVNGKAKLNTNLQKLETGVINYPGLTRCAYAGCFLSVLLFLSKLFLLFFPLCDKLCLNRTMNVCSVQKWVLNMSIDLFLKSNHPYRYKKKSFAICMTCLK